MAAQHKGRYIAHRDIEFLGQKITKARRVQHAGHAHHFVFRQAGKFLQRPDHGIKRIGNTNDKGLGRVFFDALADLPHDFQINLDQVVAAHAGFARHTGGNDDNVGTANGGIGFRAFQRGVKAANGRAFSQIECLALRYAVDNIENDNVAKFLQAGEMCQRAADLSATNECDFFTSHDKPSLIVWHEAGNPVAT